MHREVVASSRLSESARGGVKRRIGRPKCPEPFSFEVLPDRASVTLRLHGELDICGAPGLLGEAERLCGAGFDTLVIDAAGLTFIDLAGLRALRGACQTAWIFGLAFGVSYREGGPLARLLELVALPDLFREQCEPAAAPDQRSSPSPARR